MTKKSTSIPVNHFGGVPDTGYFIEKFSFTDLPDIEDWQQPERHDRHSFFLLEKGTVSMEIDFQKYKIKSPSVIYMHPNQVHRILSFNAVTVISLGIDNESLNGDYLKLLEGMTPVRPLPLAKKGLSMLKEATSLGIQLSQRKQDKLNQLLFKDSCHVCVALIISLYAEQGPGKESRSRFDAVHKEFTQLLERHYTHLKSPSYYAGKLNLSTAYLNECVKKTSGYPVSYHIQQRVILEAKRLLYHSDKSVKEIAAELGYDDYPYFSRLFTKVAGMTALSFRNKNRD